MKRETGPKPLNVNAQNAWRCRDPGIRASRPWRDETRKEKGVARRIKERQHWAGICAGMTMALVYIEPHELAKSPLRVNPGDHLSWRVRWIHEAQDPSWGGEGKAKAKATKAKTSKDERKEICQ